MHRWTTSELKYIEDNAGSIPIHQLRKRFDCSPDALKSAKKRINADRALRGLAPITLKCDKPLYVCPKCDQKTDRIVPRTGWCRACTAELKLESYHERLEKVDREVQRERELEPNKAREKAVKRSLDNLKQKKRTRVKSLVKLSSTTHTDEETTRDDVTPTRDPLISHDERSR